MADLAVSTPTIDVFFRRWEASGAAERANYSMFLNELCDLLDVPRPDPAGPDDEKNAYVFERTVPFPNPDGTTTVKRIDLYKRDCFVLEAKQGSDRVEATEPFSLTPHRRMRRGTAVRGTAGWDAAMYEAKGQAELYVRNLPASEHNPPFIIVADVGHSIELFSDFSRQGRTYIPFPDPRTHRLKLRDLAEAEIRERLKAVWTEPLALDPSRRTAKVTREVAAKLAELARSLEHSGYAPDLVAHFLMRCLFTFFAEDVGLLPKDCFTAMLSRLREEGRITAFPDMAGSLWATMKTGGFSPILMQSVLRFNGGLFDQATGASLDRRTDRPADRLRAKAMARSRARDIWNAAGAGPRQGRAAHAGRSLHAPGLRRAAGAADDRRAPPRAVGQRTGRGRHAGEGRATPRSEEAGQ